MTDTDTLTPPYGLQGAVEPGSTAVWGARFIVNQDGHVDLPHDRHKVVYSTPKDRDRLLDSLQAVYPLGKLHQRISQGLVEREIDTRVAADIILVENEDVRMVGNTNGSAGYFYVTAYLIP